MINYQQPFLTNNSTQQQLHEHFNTFGPPTPCCSWKERRREHGEISFSRLKYQVRAVEWPVKEKSPSQVQTSKSRVGFIKVHTNHSQSPSTGPHQQVAETERVMQRSWRRSETVNVGEKLRTDGVVLLENTTSSTQQGFSFWGDLACANVRVWG